MNVFRAMTTFKQEWLKKKYPEHVRHLKGREGKLFNTHFTFICKALITLLAGEWPHWRAVACVYFPVSEQRSLVCDHAWTLGCYSFLSGVVYSWLLYSLYLGDKPRAQPTVQRSCGWQFENIWKGKGFPLIASVLQKSCSMCLCAHDNYIWQNEF